MTPIKGGKVTTAYGIPGRLWSAGHHTGVDFAVPVGTPVLAPVSGVVSAYNGGSAYGIQVVIEAGGKRHLLCHLSKRTVTTGQRVTEGQQVGLSGNTGNSTGPHLHYEVRNLPPGTYGSDINPGPYLDNQEESDDMPIAPPSPRYVGPAKWKGASNNKPINRIVIHCTAGAEPGSQGAAENTVNFSKRTSTPSSYHYIADALKSLQYVYDSVVAYHAPPNQHSIGYELCCSLSGEGKGHWTRDDHVKMLRIVAKDCARLALAYNVPIVKLGAVALRAGKRGFCGHADVRDAWRQTTHWDPGPYFPWKQFLALVKAEANALRNPDKPDEPKVTSRGAAIEHAIEDLVKAAKRAEKQPARLRKIKVALDSLRTIKAR